MTSSSEAKGCMRAARLRSSPGVWGPRSSSSQSSARSAGSSSNSAIRRSRYLTVREVAPEKHSASRFS
ncbi:MAG: hypothetical protein BWX70_03029 [Verrucomicrobia bacterium ADurb.Bin070]|nr:MAG: hypothetical protein BWX70_03029 [Verrucomicrobia bacterium ADurb.Bin070]